MKKMWFTKDTVALLKTNPPLISFDLGRTLEKPSKRAISKIPLSDIKGDFIYCWDSKNLYKLALFHDHFYRLRLWNGIPILEIDGVRMHLVKDFETPLDYSMEISHQLHIHSNDVVLDSCGGLGYTAIAASRSDATVISYEISKEVLTLAKWNPWSKEYFSSPNISVKNADIAKAIKNIKDSQFSVIIHDPPRFSTAGELYSYDFYRELKRVAKPGCRIFHYTGTVGSTRRGRNIENEVRKRLIAAGWYVIRYSSRLQGLFALNPVSSQSNLQKDRPKSI